MERASPGVDWRFVAAATFVLTCLFTLQSIAWSAGTPSWVVHERQLISWGIWLALTPAIVAAVGRYTFAEGSRARWLLRHVGLGLLFASAATAIAVALRSLLGDTISPALGPATVAAVAANFAGDLLRYAIIAVSYQAVAYHRAVRERDAMAAKLRADLAEAKLANIEGRLHPHFLFNTLNSIAALVREDPAGAEAMVEQLSELLRASLTANPLRETPLEEELRLTEQYLAIQSVRFQHRLRATIVASNAARQGRVPQLILQPLVENAVRHGIAPREAGGSLTVTASVQDDTLLMTVEDDGVGIGNAPTAPGSGLGLNSVQSRLAHLYAARQQFDVKQLSPSGTRVTIALPYRPIAS